MTEYTQKVLAKQFRQGKRLTLILLLYGMAVTVLAFFTHVMEAVPWLLPFAISSIPFDRWFDPVYIFLPLAIIPLAGWMALHLGKLWGRECIIAAMAVYLALNLIFTPFYLLIVSTSWNIDFVGQVFFHSLCGTVYPILVLIALHRWNPRRK